jgi:hypothetical protein
VVARDGRPTAPEASETGAPGAITVPSASAVRTRLLSDVNLPSKRRRYHQKAGLIQKAKKKLCSL